MAVTGRDEPVLIDLDVARPEPPPGRTAPRPWKRPRRLGAGVAAVVVAVAVSVTSEPPSGLGAGISAPLTVKVTGTPKMVIGDTVYTAAAGSGGLSAYSLRTGRLRWRADVPDLVHSYFVGGGRYLFVSYPQDRQTAAVDVRTGAVRWKRPGTPLWLAPAGDRVALVSQTYPADASSPSTSVVRMVTMATGRESAVVSRSATESEVSPVFGGDTGVDAITGVFVRQDDGGGRLFDFATGRDRRLDLAKLPLPAFDSQFRYETVLTVGDLTLQWGASDSGMVLTAYAGEPLRRLWSTSGLGLGRAWMCGGALCLADHNQSAVLDPNTGQIRWRPGWATIWPGTGSKLLASDLSGETDGRGVGVLDQASGRELLRQELWRPVARLDGARLPVLAYSGGGQILAVLDVARQTTYRLARLRHLLAECWASSAYVVCLAGPDRLRAWRYSS